MNPDNFDPRIFLDMNRAQLHVWAESQTPEVILAAVRAIYAEMGRLQEEIFEEIDQDLQDEDLSEANAVINRIRAM